MIKQPIEEFKCDLYSWCSLDHSYGHINFEPTLQQQILSFLRVQDQIIEWDYWPLQFEAEILKKKVTKSATLLPCNSNKLNCRQARGNSRLLIQISQTAFKIDRSKIERRDQLHGLTNEASIEVRVFLFFFFCSRVATCKVQPCVCTYNR